jgi:hypothetical protein
MKAAEQLNPSVSISLVALAELVLKSANAVPTRFTPATKDNPTLVHFTSVLGGPECCLPVAGLCEQEIRRELARVQVVPVVEAE